jgi:hypothetical protein
VPSARRRCGELVAEAALAHAGLAGDSHDLPVAGAGLLQRHLERLQLAVAPDEAPEAARLCDIESPRAAPTPVSS